MATRITTGISFGHDPGADSPTNKGFRLVQILCDGKPRGWVTLEEDWTPVAGGSDITGPWANRGGTKLYFYANNKTVALPQIHITMAARSLGDRIGRSVGGLISLLLGRVSGGLWPNSQGPPIPPITDANRGQFQDLAKRFFSLMRRVNSIPPPMMSYPHSEDEVLESDEKLLALYYALLLILGIGGITVNVRGGGDVTLPTGRELLGIQAECVELDPKGPGKNKEVKVGGVRVRYGPTGGLGGSRGNVKITVLGGENYTCKVMGKDGKLVTYPALAALLLPAISGSLPKYPKTKLVGC